MVVVDLRVIGTSAAVVVCARIATAAPYERRTTTVPTLCCECMTFYRRAVVICKHPHVTAVMESPHAGLRDWAPVDSPLAVVLAAGGGSRYHGPQHKLLADVGGATVSGAAIATAVAAGLGATIVVTGDADVEVPEGVVALANRAGGRASPRRSPSPWSTPAWAPGRSWSGWRISPSSRRVAGDRPPAPRRSRSPRTRGGGPARSAWHNTSGPGSRPRGRALALDAGAA